MDMDIYKVTIFAMVMVVLIVGFGIYMGLSSTSSSPDEVYLSGPVKDSGSTSNGKAQTQTQAQSQVKSQTQQTASAQQQTEPKQPAPAKPASTETKTNSSVNPSDSKGNAGTVKVEQNKLNKPKIYSGPVYYPIIKKPSLADGVILTFEDGTSLEYVNKALKSLSEKKVNATFFITAEALSANPEVWKKAVNEGHEICNHTYNHQDFDLLNELQITEEIMKWEEVAKSVLGESYVNKMKKEFPYFRFPSSEIVREEKLLRIVSSLGYRSAGWTIETMNSEISSNTSITGEERAKLVYTYVTEKTKSGNVLSLKLNFEDTRYLGEMIESFKNNGIGIKKMSDVFKITN